MALPRMTGHAFKPQAAGKYGHTIQPRCRCGWSGSSGLLIDARSQYAAHVGRMQNGHPNLEDEVGQKPAAVPSWAQVFADLGVTHA